MDKGRREPHRRKLHLDTFSDGIKELFDCKTGDHRLVRKIGLIPDDRPLWRPKG
jgi:hypothetical protein